MNADRMSNDGTFWCLSDQSVWVRSSLFSLGKDAFGVPVRISLERAASA